MCMHNDNNSEGITYVSRRADRANYDPIGEQYVNRIRGEY